MLVLVMAVDTTLASVPTTIPVVKNLSQDMQLAQEQGTPILVEFSLPGCHYCVTLEEEVLQPMMRSGEYDDKVILRQLVSGEYNQVMDFTGESITGSALAEKHNITIYPTLVFFDGRGKEVGERLVGVILLDYYFAELDRALRMATEEMVSHKDANPAKANTRPE